MADVKAEAARLLKEGKSPAQVRVELESKGFSTDDVAHALADSTKQTIDNRTAEERKNSFLFSIREVFDRIGYGAATPQFVNILFWLSQQTQPYILPLIGLLNGIKTVLSVVWSGLMQEYSKLHRISKNAIAAGGIIFGFSFLFMAFGLLLRNNAGLWLFAFSFLLGTVGIVAYGDLYQKFVHDTIRRERMSGFLRTIGTWGILITAISLILAGFLIDYFPTIGTPWSFMLFGKAFQMQVYGYLLAFEITAFAFILAGYVSSQIIDKREERSYPFMSFLREQHQIIKNKMVVFHDKYVLLLLIATVVSGFLQIIIASYSGIAMYRIFVQQYDWPFFTLAIVYSIAIIAAFTGPFFTERIHRSTGLAPTLVFGTLLTATLPLVLVYNPNIAAITASLCLHVIGASIVGFAQGLLAQKLMTDDTRHGYFQAQAFIIVIPYLVLLPVLGWLAYALPLETLFLIVAAGLIVVVMPIYFVLVAISQKVRL
jgi:MFS family permease